MEMASFHLCWSRTQLTPFSKLQGHLLYLQNFPLACSKDAETCTQLSAVVNKLG